MRMHCGTQESGPVKARGIYEERGVQAMKAQWGFEGGAVSATGSSYPDDALERLWLRTAPVRVTAQAEW